MNKIITMSWILFIFAITIHSSNSFRRFPAQHRTPKSHPRLEFTTESMNESIAFVEMVTTMVRNSLKNYNRFKHSPVQVKPNTISYAQWIDGSPSSISIEENIIATAIEEASKHLKSSVCPYTIRCVDYFKGLPLPESETRDKCFEIRLKSNLIPFRRLFAANYSDSLHEVELICFLN